jgi:1-acyl-sn-glycerol-3-phosphate acyltransferase
MSGAPRREGSTSPHTPLGRRVYDSMWVLCRAITLACFGIRARFAEPVPPTGGLIVLSTHQSHLDPVLLGVSCTRRLSSLARDSLFRFRPLGWLITALDAVPIDRDAPGVAALKAIIARLRAGAAVIIFPEGTRTATGRPARLKNGFVILARRSAVPILPVAIVGAWECWPRSQLLPRPGRVRVEFGRLITPAEITSLDDEALLATCTARLEELDTRGRAALAGPARSPRRELRHRVRTAARAGDRSTVTGPA